MPNIRINFARRARSGRSAAPYEATGPGPGVDAIGACLLAGHDGGRVAVGVLQQAPPPGRQVMHEAGRAQPEASMVRAASPGSSGPTATMVSPATPTSAW